MISENPCSSCCSCSTNIIYETNRKESRLKVPAKLNAPIKFTSPDRIKLTLQDHRLKCKQLEHQIQEMRSSLEKFSEPVDSELGKDFVSLFDNCDEKVIPPFMKLFWQEQQKYISTSNSKNTRYHPMVIKYCLSLAAKSIFLLLL